MSKFLKTTTRRVEVPVMAPEGSEGDVKELIGHLDSKEIKTLLKVAKNPALKAMAIGAASNYV